MIEASSIIDQVRILIYDSHFNYKSVIDLSSYTFCSPRSVNYLNGEIFVKVNLSCRIADGRLLSEYIRTPQGPLFYFIVMF